MTLNERLHDMTLNERLHDMTLNGMLLDVGVLPKKTNILQTSKFN